MKNFLLVLFSLSILSSVALLPVLTQAKTEMVTLPGIYVENLTLDKEEYKAGDTVKGTFTILNSETTAISNIYYLVLLMGDYKNTIPQTQYDRTEMTGPFNLSPGEKRTLDFTYIIPKAISGEGLGIQVHLAMQNGAGLGWNDKMIKITGGTGFLKLLSTHIEVGKNGFGVQEGPMIYEGDKAYLFATFQNDTKNAITATPTVKIQNRSDVGEVLKEFTESSITIKPNSSVDLKIELPTFDYTPRVYVGKLEMLDTAKNAVAPALDFRYIIFGDIVTINNLTSDKESVGTGDILTLKLDYSGAPFDILTGKVASSTPADLNVKIFNQKDKLVAEYSDKTDFNVEYKKVITISAERNALALRAEVLVSRDSKTITEYKATLSKNFDLTKNQIDWRDYFNIKTISISIIILLVALILIFIKKWREKKVILVILFSLLVLTAGLFVYLERAKAFIQTYYAWQGPGTRIYNLFVNSPIQYNFYELGSTMPLTISVNADACNNRAQELSLTATREGVSVSATAHRDQYAPGVLYAAIAIPNLSVSGPVGEHSISLDIRTWDYDWGNSAILQGYQPYYVKITGACGNANGRTFANTETGYGSYSQCSKGPSNNGAFPAPGGSVSWTCLGQFWGANASCSASRQPAAITGSCSGTHYGCTAGTSVANESGTSGYAWRCNGSNGGGNVSCSEAKVNGACSATHYNCSVGTSANNVNGASSYTWNCNGSNGGTNASCSEAKVNGACSATHYNCSVGTSANNVNGASSYTWNCNGSNGGGNVSCSETKPLTPLSVTCSVSPATTTKGSLVTWTANPTGGNGTYTYLWNGDASGTTKTVTASYSTTGTKNATVKITSSGVSPVTSSSCTNSVGGGGGGGGGGTTITDLGAPILTATSSSTCGGITHLSWTGVSSIEGYRVYKLTGGSWIRIDSTSSRYYDVAASTADWFKVTSYNGQYESTSSPAVGVQAVPSGGCPVTLTVFIEGTGKVTSDKAGINGLKMNCLSSTCNNDFGYGTTVNLTAATTSSSHRFKGWTGACAGVYSNPLCSLTSLKLSTSTTARFILSAGDCTIAKIPSGRPGVNKMVNWTVETPETMGCPGNCIYTWTATDMSSSPSGNTWNKIYTTIGTKNVSVDITRVDSDGSERFSSCSTSTNVMLIGDPVEI